jgi:N-acetylglutamate synthase-like GNAT family acetyltransferase
LIIRKALIEEVDSIKKITDQNKNELGFVLKPALVRSVQQNEVLVVLENEEIVGFCNYHHRLDKRTTLHNILIIKRHQGNGVGLKLFLKMVDEAKQIGQYEVILRCPQDLSANEFYRRIGCHLSNIEEGKKRRLCVWTYKLL